MIKNHFKNIFNDFYSPILTKYLEKYDLKTDLLSPDKENCVNNICNFRKISEKELLEECIKIADQIFNCKSVYLRIYPDEILRKSCLEISIIDEYINVLCKTMKHVMLKNNGIGLAAPQVGIPMRLFIMKSKNFGIVNPKILSYRDPVQSEEKCLSIPDITKIVKRHKFVDVSYLNTMGFEVKETLTGNDAICFCHEFDHLNGKLIID
jgi:peptide deformylase